MVNHGGHVHPTRSVKFFFEISYWLVCIISQRSSNFNFQVFYIVNYHPISSEWAVNEKLNFDKLFCFLVFFTQLFTWLAKGLRERFFSYITLEQLYRFTNDSESNFLSRVATEKSSPSSISYILLNWVLLHSVNYCNIHQISMHSLLYPPKSEYNSNLALSQCDFDPILAQL